MRVRPDFPEVIDNSMIADFRSCPTKCFRTYFEHWKPKRQSIHLHAGAAFAAALETVRVEFFQHQQPPDAAIAAGLRTLLLEWGDYQPADNDTKTLDRMAGALEYYFHHWPLEVEVAPPAVLPSGRLGIEFQFIEPLEIRHPTLGQPILYSGRADQIVALSGGRFIEDDKTTGQLGASWPHKWELRSQFTGYCWAARHTGIPVDGILVRGVAILKDKYNGAQALTYRAQWEIDRWYEQTHRDLARMIRCWEDGVWDYDLADACDAYGGCPFNKICKANNPDEWLPLYFERRIWDPATRTERPLLSLPA